MSFLRASFCIKSDPNSSKYVTGIWNWIKHHLLETNWRYLSLSEKVKNIITWRNGPSKHWCHVALVPAIWQSWQSEPKKRVNKDMKGGNREHGRKKVSENWIPNSPDYKQSGFWTFKTRIDCFIHIINCCKHSLIRLFTTLTTITQFKDQSLIAILKPVLNRLVLNRFCFYTKCSRLYFSGRTGIRFSDIAVFGDWETSVKFEHFHASSICIKTDLRIWI